MNKEGPTNYTAIQFNYNSRQTISKLRNSMESVKEIYKIGHGPSSSHTMAPRKAAQDFLNQAGEAWSCKITLYGSLAATAKGHLTLTVLSDLFEGKRLEIIEKPEEFLQKHPNGMKFEAFDANNKILKSWTAYSIGGGSVIDDNSRPEEQSIYPIATMEGILDWCYKRGKPVWGYVEKFENNDIWDYLEEVWKVMKASIHRGLDADGTLPGELKLPRKAGSILSKAKNFKGYIRKRSML